MNFPRQAILDLCTKWGPEVSLPPGIDGARLMYAIGMNESGCGANCTPRHEPAFDTGGRYALGKQADLLRRFGRDAACSYGPWQIMLGNTQGFSPAELLADAEKNALAYVHFMNTYVFEARHAETLQQIFETYNSGSFGPDKPAGVLRYAGNGVHFYNTAPIGATL